MYRLHRFGVIDINNFTVKDNYVLIFLGDVIDRGTYGMEILYFIMKLMNNNLNKIFLNRGNHEEQTQYSYYGFKTEFTKKIENEELRNTIENLYITFFTGLSSAIILNIDNKKNFGYVMAGFLYIKK
jgi:hypothetical protein